MNRPNESNTFWTEEQSRPALALCSYVLPECLRFERRTGRETSFVKQPGSQCGDDESSPMFGAPLPQQPAPQLICDAAPIGLAFLSPYCRLSDAVESIVRSIVNSRACGGVEQGCRPSKNDPCSNACCLPSAAT